MPRHPLFTGEIESEIEREIPIKEITREDFAATITEEEMDKYSEQVRPFVFAVSKVSKSVDELWCEVILSRHYQRLQMAEKIRFMNKLTNAAYWLIGVIVAAALAVLIPKLFQGNP